MNLNNIFFFLPSKGKFLSSFNNETIQSQADSVWRQLDGLNTMLIVIMVIIGIGLAFWYYLPYNEKPGRHYKISHWAFFFLGSILFTFFVTLGIEYFGIKTHLKNGVDSLFLLTALNNALYGGITFLILSFLWCNFFPTNAYRFLKI